MVVGDLKYATTTQMDHSSVERATTRSRTTRVAYITYGHFSHGHEWRFSDLVLASLKTWLKGDHVYYFVLNKQWKEKLDAACMVPEHVELCKRVVPIYVNCPEGYYGASPCCKMDQGLTEMWKNFADNYDWFVYQDDDMYLRTDYLRDFVSGLDPDKAIVLTFYQQEPHKLGSHQENCSTSKNYLYPWGQPVVYSKRALQTLSKAFGLGAVQKQCQAFGVTHDVGNPILGRNELIRRIGLIPSLRASHILQNLQNTPFCKTPCFNV